MKKFLLKLVGISSIWNYILEGSKLTEEDFASDIIWKEVFLRVPDLRSWLRSREIRLLKTLMLDDKTKDFIKGQIAEIKLIQRFDVPSIAESKKVVQEEVKLPDKKDFLNKWNKKDADKKQEGKENKKQTTG